MIMKGASKAVEGGWVRRCGIVISINMRMAVNNEMECHYYLIPKNSLYGYLRGFCGSAPIND